MGISFDNFYPNTTFFISPLKRVTSLVVEKEAESIFIELISYIFEYFKDIKRHRSIKDVEDVFETLENSPILEFLEEIEEKDFEEENSKLNQELDNLLEIHKDNLIEAVQDERLEEISYYWIFAIESVTKQLKLATKEFKRQLRFIEHKANRAIRRTMNKLEDILKGVFLVLFRITEQIYMISNDDPIEIEKEISYLLEDVVYLENLAHVTLLL